MSSVSVKMDKTLNKEQEEVLENFKEFQQAMIDKDSDKLDILICEDYTLTHMSGKTQTKEEFITDIINGVLNYYSSTIYEPTIKINNDKAKLKAYVELDAKVYGIKGTWTLKTNVQMKKKGSYWQVNDWKT